METEEGRRAGRVRVALQFDTLAALKAGTGGSTKSDMSIPHTSDTLRASGIMDVPLHNDGASGAGLSAEDQVADLDDTGATGRADLDGNSGVVQVAEVGAGSQDLGPDFASNDGTSGDLKRICDDVCSSIEVWKGG